MPETEELYSSDAARFLGISANKLKRMREAKIIPGRRLGNDANLYAYKLSDLKKVDPELLKPQKRGPKFKTKPLDNLSDVC